MPTWGSSASCLGRELKDFVLTRLSPDKIFPTDFDWEINLIESGYQPVFKNIDFGKLRTMLLKCGIRVADLQSISKKSIFSNITFNQCSLFPFKRAVFDHCIFDVDTKGSSFLDCSLRNCIFRNVNFKKCVINNCEFYDTSMENCSFDDIEINGGILENTSIKHSIFTASIIINIVGLSENEYELNTVDKTTLVGGTAWDTQHLNKYQDNPIIVMLYSPNDGVINSNLLLEILKETNPNIRIFLVSPETGLHHPIFLNNDFISGIILPGGPNIPVNNHDDLRTKFETQLLELAIKWKIPTLGICRGHQFIGHYFGANIFDTKSHQGVGGTIRVKKQANSMLYTHLSKEYKKNKLSHYSLFQDSQSQVNKFVLTKEYINGNKHILYQAPCMHEQAISFKGSQRNKQQIIVISKGKNDGIIEGMQINNHIITYQHHLESYHLDNKELACGVLNQYPKLVYEYHKIHRQKSEQLNLKPL